MTMALALELELELELSSSTASSPLDCPSPASSSTSTPSLASSFSSSSTPATSVTPSPCPSPKFSTTSESSEPSEPSTSSAFSFLALPYELRDRIYHLALTDTTIHVCSGKLHRRRGGPNRTKSLRRLPGILSVSKQIRKESLPLLAHHATLSFSDFFNFSHLCSLVPESFACLARKIALRGDVIVTPEMMERFPCLEEVQYTQLGNCVFAPTQENGWNAYASEASNKELVESVKARSASCVLLKGVLQQVNERRREAGKGVGDVELVAVANVLSSRERVSLRISVTHRRVMSREVVAEGHFFD